MLSIPLSREDFAGVIYSPGFYDANPAFAPLAATLVNCATQDITPPALPDCSTCGRRTLISAECFDTVIAFLNALQADNEQALTDLAQWLGPQRGRPGATSITLYVTPSPEVGLQRIKYPAAS